jgi:hypothetical protein
VASDEFHFQRSNASAPRQFREYLFVRKVQMQHVELCVGQRVDHPPQLSERLEAGSIEWPGRVSRVSRAGES